MRLWQEITSQKMCYLPPDNAMSLYKKPVIDIKGVVLTLREETEKN